ncbi:MAG: peptidoglycan-associated lipoprotein, partial [Ancylomarina sp.]
MKVLAKTTLSLSLLFCIACSPQYFARKGDKAFKKGLYYLSESKYDKAYKKSKDHGFKSEVAYKAGLSFEKINETKKAARWYKKAIRRRDSFPEALIRLAQVEIKSGDIEDAEEYFAIYEDYVPENSRGDEERLVQVFEKIKEWKENPQAYIVRPMDELNTRASEFAPQYFSGDTNIIIFTSTRKGGLGAKLDGVTGDKHSNLFRSDYTNELKRDVKNKRGKVIKTRTIVRDEFEWQKPVSIGDSVNSTFNDGAACIDPETNLLYFTSSRKVDKKARGTKIYSIAIQGDEWGELRKLNIVADSLSVGHPSISADGETLYFASDMDGGFGGNDIWMVKSDGGTWGSPVNLGADINTPKEEIFPYIRDNGMLYFSSDRYDGMGGLDLYVANSRADVWDVSNMKYPINSEADDFSIVFQSGENKGLFASSRNRGNDDIFSFEKMKIDWLLIDIAEGRISFDEGLAGRNIKVKVESDKGDKSNISLDENGGFKLPIHADTKYILTVSGDDFLTEKKVIDAGAVDEKLNLDLNFELKGVGVPIRLKNVLFGFNEWALSGEAKNALNDLVETMKEHSDIIIELSSHTDFVGSKTVNDSVSNLRAQVCFDYLVEQGVDETRLKASSFGENKPWVVKQEGQDKHPFLKVGDVLSKAFI